MLKGRQSGAQLARFIIVGLASNAILYLLYIAATALGVGHKTAMSVLYLVGVAQTFLANRTWSFGYRDEYKGALARYLAAYLLSYVLNFCVMYALVDHLGYSDKVVQGCMVIIVAALMFLLQKYWVFRTKTAPSKTEPV